MARNPALIAEALRKLGALEGGELPVFGSGQAVQPVMVVQDLSRSLAVEPFEVRGAWGYQWTGSNFSIALQPIGGFGLVVENLVFRSASIDSQNLILSSLRLFNGTIQGTTLDLTENTVRTGGGEPRSRVYFSSSFTEQNEGSYIPLRDDSDPGGRIKWIADQEVRWFAPSAEQIVLQFHTRGFGNWQSQIYLEWREVPEL